MGFRSNMLFVAWHQPSSQLCQGTPTGTHFLCSSTANPMLEQLWRSLVSLSCRKGQKSLISQTCRPLSLLCRPFLCPGLVATLRLVTMGDASTSVGTGSQPLCIQLLLPALCVHPAPPVATANLVDLGVRCDSPLGTKDLHHVWDEQIPASAVSAIPDVWQWWSCWSEQLEPETW